MNDYRYLPEYNEKIIIWMDEAETVFIARTPVQMWPSMKLDPIAHKKVDEFFPWFYTDSVKSELNTGEAFAALMVREEMINRFDYVFPPPAMNVG